MNFSVHTPCAARSDCGRYEITFAQLSGGEWLNAWFIGEGRKYLGGGFDRDEMKRLCARHLRKSAIPQPTEGQPA